MKYLATFLLVLSSSALATEKTSFYIPDGIPAISASYMIQSDKVVDGHEMDYILEKTSDSLVNKILKSEADFAIVPSNLVGQISAKNLPYKVLGTGGWGALFLVSYTELKNISELKDAKIYAFGKGLTPDAAFRNILKEKNLNPDELNISYLSKSNELPSTLFSKKADFVLVPEPILSAILVKDKDVKIVLDLGKEWNFPQSTLIVRNSIYEENKTFTQDVAQNYAKSIEKVNQADETLQEVLKQLDIKTPVPMSKEIIERANLKFIPAKDSLEVYKNYFQALYEMNPKSVGGSVPNEEIFILD
jgi:NitT/TauT family transport system substrate-binding protein